MRTCLVCLLWACVLTYTGQATEYRVASATEFNAAVATVQPGDTVTLLNGVWRDVRLVFAGTGTASAPILLRAATQGSVSIEGASNLRIAGRHLVVDGLAFRNGYSPSGGVIEFRNSSTGQESHDCRLTNTSIDSFNPSSASTDYKWISLYGTHNRVDHCYMRGKNHAGTTLVVWLSATPNHHRIDRNHFAWRPPLGVNGGETIRVGTSDWSMYDSFTIVEENLFEECNGEAEIISSKSCGNIYRANTFRRCEGALTLRHGNRCTVEGNFFFGEGAANTGGIRIIGEDHVVVNNYLTDLKGTDYRAAMAVMNGVPNSPLNRYFQVKRALIAFNTLIGNTASMDWGMGKSTELSLPPLDCRVANNVVVSMTGPLIRFTDTPVGLQWEGNVFHGAALGIPQPVGIVLADPILAAVGADGFRRPSTGSPVFEGAVGDFSAVVTDMDGQQRTGTKDIGADEASAEPILRRPLSAADVGPGSAPAAVGALPAGGVPTEYVFPPAFPNPFNPETTLTFRVPTRGRARIVIYDALAQTVAVPFDGVVEAGEHHAVRFDAATVAAGVYFAVLTHNSYRAAHRLLLLR